jgi:hypothetical protein
LNTNIHSCLRTCGGQSSSLYLNVDLFSTPVLIRHLWQLKTVVFLHWCLIHAVLLLPYTNPTNGTPISQIIDSGGSHSKARCRIHWIIIAANYLSSFINLSRLIREINLLQFINWWLCNKLDNLLTWSVTISIAFPDFLELPFSSFNWVYFD